MSVILGDLIHPSRFSELHLQNWPHDDATLADLHKKMSDYNVRRARRDYRLGMKLPELVQTLFLLFVSYMFVGYSVSGTNNTGGYLI